MLSQEVNEFLMKGGSYMPDFGVWEFDDLNFEGKQGWDFISLNILKNKNQDEKFVHGILNLKAQKLLVQQVNQSKLRKNIQLDNHSFKAFYQKSKAGINDQVIQTTNFPIDDKRFSISRITWFFINEHALIRNY